MEEKVGSFVVDPSGKVIPNLDDEAMAERHSMKKEEVKRDA